MRENTLTSVHCMSPEVPPLRSFEGTGAESILGFSERVKKTGGKEGERENSRKRCLLDVKSGGNLKRKCVVCHQDEHKYFKWALNSCGRRAVFEA